MGRSKKLWHFPNMTNGTEMKLFEGQILIEKKVRLWGMNE